MATSVHMAESLRLDCLFFKSPLLRYDLHAKNCYLKTICLFLLGCAGSPLLCLWLSLAAASEGCCLGVVHGLLTVVASLVGQHGL